MILVFEVDYFDEGDIVFGLEIVGEVWVYFKRIFGWYEMVKDKVVGIFFCGVYCMFCGSMIIYRSDFEG